MKKKKPKLKSQVEKQLPQGVLEKVRDRSRALAESFGLSIHDVTFGRTDLGLTLSVIICPAENEDKALSVTDCELISRPLSKELDDLLGDYDENYMFEVSSKGVDVVSFDNSDEK